MKKLSVFFFILFLLYPQHTFCQSLHIDSTRFITGIQCCTYIQYAIQTADKGILFVGQDNNNPGGIIPYFPIDTVLNNVLIGKIDSNQQIRWIKVYGGSSDDAAASVCQTPDGGYAVLAGTASSNGDVTGFRGAADIWLLRIDALGNLLWEKTYGSSSQDAPMSIANTPDHGFIISGTTNGSNNDVPFHYGSIWTFDWLVIKTDSLGTVQWSKDIGGTRDEQDYGSVLSVDNNYYIISSSNSTDYDCSDTAWHTGTYTFDNYHVLKLDDTGKVLWDSSYGGSGDEQANFALFDTRDSTILITGVTFSNDYMVAGNHGGQDIWVVKVDKKGKLLWQKALGSPYDENGTGICVNHNGGYLDYGWSHNGSIGQEYLCIFSLDSGGAELDNKIFGGPIHTPNYSCSILPYLSGYIATGNSGAYSFTEGTTYGNFDTSTTNPNGGGVFISYIDTGINRVRIISKEKKQLIYFYPNPATSKITINSLKNEMSIITVVNVMGQTVYKNQIQQPGYLSIEIQEWTKGVYFIECYGVDGTVQTLKLIKM